MVVVWYGHDQITPIFHCIFIQHKIWQFFREEERFEFRENLRNSIFSIFFFLCNLSFRFMASVLDCNGRVGWVVTC